MLRVSSEDVALGFDVRGKPTNNPKIPGVAGLTAFTILNWFRCPDNVGASFQAGFWLPGDGSGGGYYVAAVDVGTPGALQANGARATTVAQRVTVGGLWSLADRIFVGLTVDQTGGGLRLWFGTATVPAYEPGLASSDAGSGAWRDPIGEPFFGENGAEENPAFGAATIVPWVMTRQEIRRWQFQPQRLPGALGFWRPGSGGAVINLNGLGSVPYFGDETRKAGCWVWNDTNNDWALLYREPAIAPGLGRAAS